MVIHVQFDYNQSTSTMSSVCTTPNMNYLTLNMNGVLLALTVLVALCSCTESFLPKELWVWGSWAYTSMYICGKVHHNWLDGISEHWISVCSQEQTKSQVTVQILGEKAQILLKRFWLLSPRLLDLGSPHLNAFAGFQWDWQLWDPCIGL